MLQIKNTLGGGKPEGMYAWTKNEIGSELKEINKSISTLPYNFYRGCAVIYNGETHILGGADSTTKHYKWNGSSWASVSTLPYNFIDGCAVVLNNEIHILGSSYSSSYYKYHYKWNGSSWTSVSTLPYSFRNGCAVVLDNEIHILGSNGSSPYKDHYKWNGSSWTSVSTLPYSFYYGSAVVLNNEIHILGSGDSSYFAKHYKWDGTSWTSVSSLPYNFYQGSAVIFNNEIHILGSGDSSYFTKHYKWDGTSWTSVSTLPYGFYYGSAVVLDNGIHIIGGYNSNYQTAHYLVYGFVPVYTFLDYIVSNKETAYPDGGEKGGYWYEKVGGFLSGMVTQTVTNKKTLSFEYGSVKKPKAFYLMHMGTTSDSYAPNHLVYNTWYDELQGLNNGAYVYYSSPYVYCKQGSGSAMCEATFNNGIVTLGGNNYYSGTYLWVAIF